MKREDIIALSDLARIELTEEEIDSFSREFDDILAYVASVKDLTANVSTEPKIGVVANVLREDENPDPADLYSEDLLKGAPHRRGRYVEVKKILGS